MEEKIEHQAIIGEQYSGQRLDQAVAKMFTDYSRARLQGWIKGGQLRVDGDVKRAKDKVWGGETVKIDATLEVQDSSWVAEDIPLNIVFEDDSLLVINKPAGLVVHPAVGNYTGTLLNALLFHCPGQENLPRAGIVHRLDKETSGLMVVAKTLKAHHHLVDQLQHREVHREYEAVVNGVLTGGGTVNAPIGRHPQQRVKMAVVEGGKEAITQYRVAARYEHFTHVRLSLETGRTHQIRVHMAHKQYPLVGDPVYGGRLRLPKGIIPELEDCLRHFKRQALHAKKLSLVHPETAEWVEWEVDLSDDFQHLLDVLQRDRLAKPD
ncbi:MAG: 23S rRNA pseudouridine(1911/1915/1917) synthase RluD [Moraxellaceae bacterium]|nr:MAG: 23S rRNA pseudouridine(1911/1915/1917) synthase RluD [Moraxellaceae bacterium]